MTGVRNVIYDFEIKAHGNLEALIGKKLSFYLEKAKF